MHPDGKKPYNENEQKDNEKEEAMADSVEEIKKFHFNVYLKNYALYECYLIGAHADDGFHSCSFFFLRGFFFKDTLMLTTFTICLPTFRNRTIFLVQMKW